MTAFQRTPVLVPTGYSEASLQAIHVAKSIAGADSDVTVIYVAQDYDVTLHPLTWSGGPMPTYQMDRLLAGLRKWSEEHNLGEINLAVRIGDPGMQVCDFAEEAKSKLIVVPSHGRHGVPRLLLGSVAERIIRHCHCSVLVVRRETELESRTGPAASWFPRKYVVVPIDFSDKSKMAIETALEIAENRDGIDVVSVMRADSKDNLRLVVGRFSVGFFQSQCFGLNAVPGGYLPEALHRQGCRSHWRINDESFVALCDTGFWSGGTSGSHRAVVGSR